MKLIDLVKQPKELKTPSCHHILWFPGVSNIYCAYQSPPRTPLPINDDMELCTLEDYKVCPLKRSR